MVYCLASSGTTVFKQGDFGSYFFLIEYGEIQVQINGAIKKSISRGDSFGDLALLYSAPRSADIIACSDCYLYAIDRDTFKKSVQELTMHNFEQSRKFIDTITFFGIFSRSYERESDEPTKGLHLQCAHISEVHEWLLYRE